MSSRDFLAAPWLRVLPVKEPIIGQACPPGSKSITNRVLLLAALATGTSRITGALKSDDTGHMSVALRAMGVSVVEPDETSFEITSTGTLQAPEQALFLGNAGTATRFLTAAVASVNGRVIVDGDEHMRKRPIGPLVDALAKIGVKIAAPTGCPPVGIDGTGSMPAGRYEIDGGLSSQYVSALLMVAPLADGPVDVILTGDAIGARGYIDLTLDGMRAFGAKVEEVSPTHWRVEPTGYRATDFHVEPDASAATYLWAMEALSAGRIDIGTKAEDFSQPDAKSYAHIAAFPNMPAIIDGSQMQDSIPTLAVLAAYNETPVRFVGIENLRVKECDRIAAMSEGLNRIKSGFAEEDGDDLIIHADASLRGSSVVATYINTFADHRIAMSFALAGLMTGGITILDPACVAKTFPSYWNVFEALGVELEI